MRKAKQLRERLACSQVLKLGRNFTVRLGLKWFDMYRAGVQDVIVISKVGEVCGEGRLCQVVGCRADQLKPEVFDFKSIEDLLEQLSSAYGRPVTGELYVTVIEFDFFPKSYAEIE